MTVDIVPVQVFPGVANRLLISDEWVNTLGESPRFVCSLVSAEEVDGQMVETTLKNGIHVSMTNDQWNDWANDVVDEEYIKECIVSNLGLASA
jgi:hypothetical protein